MQQPNFSENSAGMLFFQKINSLPDITEEVTFIVKLKELQ